MTRIRFALVLAFVCLFTTSAFAVGGITKFYFSDATFTAPAVGGRYDPAWDCPEDDYWWAYGSTSGYRKIYTYPECYESGTPTVVCQVWNNGWTTVTCP